MYLFFVFSCIFGWYCHSPQPHETSTAQVLASSKFKKKSDLKKCSSTYTVGLLQILRKFRVRSCIVHHQIYHMNQYHNLCGNNISPHETLLHLDFSTSLNWVKWMQRHIKNPNTYGNLFFQSDVNHAFCILLVQKHFKKRVLEVRYFLHCFIIIKC